MPSAVQPVYSWLEAAPEAPQGADERGPECEAEREVPDRVREVERERLPRDGDPRAEVLARGERPLEGVHDRAEADPREAARDRERPAAELAARDPRQDAAAH